MTAPESPDGRILTTERQLALVDQVLGLQAQLAEATIRYQLVQGDVEIDQLRAENAALWHRVRSIEASRTWRTATRANTYLLPVRRVVGRLRRAAK